MKITINLITLLDIAKDIKKLNVHLLGLMFCRVPSGGDQNLSHINQSKQ